MKTHWKKLQNPNYLGSWDFQPGEEKILTIKGVKTEKVPDNKGKSEECSVCYFSEPTKPLILNVTNSKAIAKVAESNYIEDWNGVKVQLFTTKVSAFGETVDAVRIRSIKPVIKLPELTPDSPKWEAAKQSIADGKIDITGIKKHYSISSANEKLLLS